MHGNLCCTRSTIIFLFLTNNILALWRHRCRNRRLCLNSLKAATHEATGRSNRSLRQVALCVLLRCVTAPLRCTRSNFVWGAMWTSFLIQYGWPYDALSLVGSFIFGSCGLLPEVYTRCDNAAFANFVAAISRTNSNWFEFVRLIVATNSAAATMISIKLTVSHEANCCGDLSPQRVAATYRLVYPGLKGRFTRCDFGTCDKLTTGLTIVAAFQTEHVLRHFLWGTWQS